MASRQQQTAIIALLQKQVGKSVKKVMSNAEPGGKGRLNVEDGKYAMLPTKITYTIADGIPIFYIGLVITDPPEYEGKQGRKRHAIKNSENQTAEAAFERFVGDLKALGMTDEEADKIGGSSNGIAALIELLPEIEKRQQKVEVNVVNDTTGKYPPNIYINGPYLEDGEALEEDTEEETTEEEVEEETTEEEVVEEEAAEEEEAFVPAKGQKFKFTPVGQSKEIIATVTGVNTAKQTATLKTPKGNEHKNVPWGSFGDYVG